MKEFRGEALRPFGDVDGNAVFIAGDMPDISMEALARHRHQPGR